MKKITYKAMILAMALVLALAAVAQADTIVSPVYKFSAVQERPTEVPTVEPTAEPTAEPEVTEEPTAEPTAEPEATEEVADEPEATEEPTAEPNAEPEATEEVAAEPEATEAPAEEPTPEPTAEPLPEITAMIASNLTGLETVSIGTEMVLTLTVEGNGEYAYVVQWQMSSDNGETWQDIPDAHGDQYRLILGKEHSGIYWRALVELVTPESAE